MEVEGSFPCVKQSLKPILSHFNTVHNFRTYLFKVHFNIIVPRTPKIFRLEVCMHFSSRLACRTSRQAHLHWFH